MIEFRHLEKALKDYADALRDQYKDNLERDNRRASGNLISSINTKITVGDYQWAIDFQLAEYWKYVEWDTKPHILPRYAIDGEDPNRPSLLQWIRWKQILPTPTTISRNGKQVTILPTEHQLAWMIANKIAKEGTDGTHDLEDALYEVDYEHILVEALDEDIWENIDQIVAFL